MTLYNIRSADGQFRITKFTNDLEVESSYIVSEVECECPAGVRPTCRHRTMLPKMLAVGAEDSPMFYDFDRDQFFEPITNEVEDMQPAIVSPIEDTDAVGPAKRVEPQYLEGLSQTVETTIVYPIDVANLRATPHPSIGAIKRRI